jgi:DNA-binding NtrC family response regulator
LLNFPTESNTAQVTEMKKAIVCVDDEAAILSALQQQMMRAFGNQYLFEFAESGKEAIEVVHELIDSEYIIHAIITDEMMPDMRGHQLIAEVTQISPTTRFVLLTGYIDTKVEDDIKANSKVIYLTKPWEFNDLIEALEDIGRG